MEQMHELGCVLGRGDDRIVDRRFHALVANSNRVVPAAFGHRHVRLGARVAYAVSALPAVMLRKGRDGGGRLWSSSTSGDGCR